MTPYQFTEAFRNFTSMIMGIFLYGIPMTLNTCIVSYLPNIFYIVDVYNILFDLVYGYIAYGLLFLYITKKFPETFESLGYTYSNLPTHPYIYLLMKLSFVLLTLPMLFVSHYMKILLNIFVYSIYISQLVYLFLDVNKHFFNNNIEFYNSNVIILNITSTVYSILETLLFKQFSLIFFIIYTIIAVPVLIKSSYITEETSYINYFYIPERVMSKVLLICNINNDPIGTPNV